MGLPIVTPRRVNPHNLRLAALRQSHRPNMNAKNKLPLLRKASGVCLLTCMVANVCLAQSGPRGSWRTNWERHSVDLSEIISGGVPKDGIPPIDQPDFVSTSSAASWIGDREPVILLAIGDDARAYPLQIMTYHEIVNDKVGGQPVTVTFCPLCYSAIVFRRELDGTVYDFGVSGMLRHSDLLMYDRQTESLWQQILGEAIVGDLTGKKLEPVPAQIVSFEQFRDRYPDGKVLSRRTGHSRPYGRNPYAGYDDISKRPFLFDGNYDDRLPPMEKVITVSLGAEDKAYPHNVSRQEGVINDMIDGIPIVVFHGEGAATALGDAIIRDAKEQGTTGVFERTVGTRLLSFAYENDGFRDYETGSRWDITGLAVSGPLEGAQLRLVPHGNYFSFAWFAFKPATKIYSMSGK